jgi:hypothetical protein
MMHAHGQSIAASALTHRQMGMAGHYHSLGAVDTAELTKTGIDAGQTFLASGGDVDTLYEPAFAALTTLSMAIPQPGGALVSLGISAAKIGTDAIRETIKQAFRASGKYLPIKVSEQVIRDLSKSPTSWWLNAARDKFSQYAGSSFAATAAVGAYNATVKDADKLNVGVKGRTADQLYKTAIAAGAKPWQAAMAAYQVAVNTSDDTGKANYAKIAGSASNPEAAWKQQVQSSGGVIVDAKTAEKAGVKPDTEGLDTTTLIALGAAGVAALLLLMPKKGA